MAIKVARSAKFVNTAIRAQAKTAGSGPESIATHIPTSFRNVCLAASKTFPADGNYLLIPGCPVIDG